MVRKAGPLGTLVFSVLFCIVGYFLAFHYSKPTLEKAKASESWPATTATIESSGLESKRKDGKTMYWAEIRFSYEVDSKTYTSDQIRVGGTVRSSNSSEARELVNKYPKGAKAEAYYAPDDPAGAVLEKGTDIFTYLPYVVGLVFLALGVLVLVSFGAKIAFAFSR